MLLSVLGARVRVESASRRTSSGCLFFMVSSSRGIKNTCVAAVYPALTLPVSSVLPQNNRAGTGRGRSWLIEFGTAAFLEQGLLSALCFAWPCIRTKGSLIGS